jgi:hypothetical protein
MHDTRTVRFTDPELLAPNVLNDGVREGSIGISRSRMHREISRFVDHDQVLILEDDLKRQIERLQGRRSLRRKRHLGDISHLELEGRLGDDLAVDCYHALLDPPFDL